MGAAVDTSASSSAAAARDDALDAFVASEPREGRVERNFQPHRVLLSLGMTLAVGWMASEWVDEAIYHFSGGDLVELGDATNLNPDEDLKTGRYVRIGGVLGNKAATINGVFRPGSLRTAPVQIRQLLGSHVFVEFDQEELGKKYTQWTNIIVEGRLVDFGPAAPGPIQVVRQYLWERQGLLLPDNARLLIVGERPGHLWTYPVVIALLALLAFMSLRVTVRSLRPQFAPHDD